MTDIISVLEEIYNPLSSPQAQMTASQHLEKWQNSFEAWESCIQILSSMNYKKEIKIFAAQTLKKKVI